MTFRCPKCSKLVKDSQQSVSCDGCESWTHRVCGTGLTIKRFREIKRNNEDFPFQCQHCQAATPAPEPPTVIEPESVLEASVEPESVLEASVEPESVLEVSVVPESVLEASVVPESVLEASTVPDHEFIPDISAMDITMGDIEDVVEVLERSMNESTTVMDPPDVPDFTPVRYEIIQNGSQLGKPKLVDTNGYSYVLKETTKTRTGWRCSVRSKKLTCKATVSQYGAHFKEGLHPHNHPAVAGKLTMVKVRTQIKERAVAEIFTSGHNIVEDVQQELVDPNAPGGADNVNQLIRIANRARENLRPKEPVDLEFELVEDFLPEGFLRRDIEVEGQRHLVCVTDRQLLALSRSRQWFLDGTFKAVRKPFLQLLSVHAFVREGEYTKMVPLAFAIMSRRKTIDYIKVLRALKQLMPEDEEVVTVMSDFEQATWKAVAKVFPQAKLRGCLFHFTQAVWHKVQEIGLAVAYMQDDSTHRFIRKLMALPFLPVDDITRVFERIEATVEPQGKVYRLVKYFRKQWIRHCLFKPRSWCCFKQRVRTNNNVEGWHRRLNNKLHERTLGIYQLVPFLLKEAELLPLQCKLVRDGKLTAHCRRHATTAQQTLFSLCEDLEQGDLTLTQFLRQVAAIHGPVVQVPATED